MKYLVLFLMLPLLGYSQFTSNDCVVIRNYRYSSLLILDKRKCAEYYFGNYGNLLMNQQESSLNRFLYSSQDYSSELNLYFFSSRIYSSKTKHFLQVDPKSQLYSSYSYLEGDPINFTDKDGEEKIPLILYEECQWFEGGKHYSTADLMTQIGKDAYYVPLTDFMNGSVGDLSDWNGNVFIDAHLERKVGNEVQVESSPRAEWLRSNNEEVQMYKQFEPEEYFGITDARSLGENIGRLSMQRGVQVHNIFMGGCQGKEAGERLGEAFKNTMPNQMNRELWIHALKNEKYSVIAGKQSTSGKNVEGLDETRYYVSNTKEDYFNYKKTPTFRGGKRHSLGIYRKSEQGLPEPLPYATGEELEQMVRQAKVPKNLQGHFDSFPILY